MVARDRPRVGWNVGEDLVRAGPAYLERAKFAPGNVANRHVRREVLS